MINSQEMLDLYIEAEKAILSGKSFSFQGRTISYESLNDIRNGREYWERRVNKENSKNKNNGLNFSVADLSKRLV